MVLILVFFGSHERPKKGDRGDPSGPAPEGAEIHGRRNYRHDPSGPRARRRQPGIRGVAAAEGPGVLFDRLEKAPGGPVLIAIDSSSWIAYLAGEKGDDVEAVEASLAARQVCLPPVVLTEILSDSKLPEDVLSLFRQRRVSDHARLGFSAVCWNRRSETPPIKTPSRSLGTALTRSVRQLCERRGPTLPFVKQVPCLSGFGLTRGLRLEDRVIKPSGD